MSITLRILKVFSDPKDVALAKKKKKVLVSSSFWFFIAMCSVSHPYVPEYCFTTMGTENLGELANLHLWSNLVFWSCYWDYVLTMSFSIMFIYETPVALPSIPLSFFIDIELSNQQINHIVWPFHFSGSFFSPHDFLMWVSCSCQTDHCKKTNYNLRKERTP